MCSSWLEQPLGDLVSHMSRGIAPKYVEDKSATMVIGQRCGRNQQIDLSQTRFHDAEEKPVKKEKMVKPFDILINATGVGSAGRVAQIGASAPKDCTTDSHILTLRAHGIDPLYLGYYLKSKQRIIEGMAEGSTGQTEMNRERLKSEIVVPFPSERKAQKKIAGMLLAFDERIALNDRINDYLAA